jgi:hypothetical protein
MTVEVLAPPPPTATIAVSPASVGVNTAFTVTWSSTYTSGCSPTGSSIAAAGQTWLGTPLASAGSETITPTAAGEYSLGIACQSVDPSQGAASASTQVSVTPSAVTLTASPASLKSGQTLTLTWAAVAASQCLASGGGATGSIWSGALPNSGTTTQTATHAGTFTYAVTCTGGSGLPVRAAAVVSVSAPAGGGGAIDLIDLTGLLAAMLWARRLNTKPA